MYLCEGTEHKHSLIPLSYENWSLIWLVYNRHSSVRNSRCSVSSVGRASVLWAEGHGFEPHIEQYCDLTATHQSLFKIWWSQQLLCSNSNTPKQSLLSFVYEHSTKCLLHKGYIMLNLTSNINGNVQQISLSLFMTGCRFDPCCSTRKRGLVPMENCLFPETFCLILFYLR